MRNRRLSVLVLGIALTMVPVCGFAADGQVLINQSTVMAFGGFPYRITQPGSYKLSGNLTLNTSQNANYTGPGGPADVAILIGANNISLSISLDFSHHDHGHHRKGTPPSVLWRS